MYESGPIRSKTTDKFFPGCTSVCQYNNAPNECLGIFNLFLAHAVSLICSQTNAIDVLKGFFGIHLDELSHIAPNKGGRAERWR